MHIPQPQGRQVSEGTQLACNTEEAWLLDSLFLKSLEFFRFDNIKAIFLGLLFMNICRAVEMWILVPKELYH